MDTLSCVDLKRLLVPRPARRGLLPAMLAAAALLGTTPALAVDGVWSSTTGGVALNWSDTSNWQSGTIADGATFTADFSQLDPANNVNVNVDTARTIGHMLLGDTSTATGAAWNVFTTTGGTLTLDNGASAPTISVSPLVANAASPDLDHAQITAALLGTSGFTKLGDGILALGADEAGLTGVIDVNAGTLRLIDGAANVPAVSLGDGATLDITIDGIDVGASAGNVAVSVKAGATATIATSTGVTTFGTNLTSVAPEGGGASLNLVNGGISLAEYYGDWAQGNSFDAVNFTSGRHRLRSSSGFGGNNFANTAVSITGVGTYVDVRTNSGGNTLSFGSLSGDADATLGSSGNNGGPMTFQIGGLNTNTEFAGTITNQSSGSQTGGTNLIKVGTGTLTLSGVLNYTTKGSSGGLTRIEGGTLALAGPDASIAGGADAFTETTVDIQGAGTLDVSGFTGAYSTSAFQRVVGTGLISGNYTHGDGTLLPGDTTSGTSRDTTAAFGTLNFGNDLTFAGGTVLFDMNATPGGDDLLQVFGTTNVSGGGIVDPNFVGGTPAAGLTYTLVNSAAFDVGNGPVAGWTVNWPGRGAKPTVFVDGADLKFTTTAVGGVADLVWTGATNSTWDVETTQNWSNSGSADVYFQGDNVTFDDTGANPIITLPAVVNPGNIVVNSTAAGNNYSFSGGSILAGGTLTKQGDSTLTLNEVNEFSGVSVEGGAIDVSAVGGTLGTGALTLAGGSVVNLGGGGSLTNSSIEAAAGTSSTLSYNGTSGAGNSSSRPTLAGLTGSGEVSVVLNTQGSWMDLFSTNGFTGTLNYGPDGTNATALGLLRIYSGVNFAGAEVNLSAVDVANRSGGDSQVFEFGELNGDASANLFSKTGGGSTAAIWQIGDLNTDSLFEGTINDDSDTAPNALSHVVKVGTGTLTLTGLSTYTGDTTVEDGTLSVTNAFFADTADIFVGSSAILDLNHAITDVIDSLYFGTSPQAVGTYGRTGLAGVDFNVPWITGDGILDVSTLGAVLANPGDYNNDGVVDGQDYAVWRENLGGTLPFNETDNPGTVDTGDLNVWLANYGTVYSTSAPAAAPVPEPMAVAGLVLSLLPLGISRRRRIAAS